MRIALSTIGSPRVAIQQNVNAPPELAWRLLTDTSQWPQWGPSVQKVVTPRRFIEMGSRGRVVTPIGVSVPFEIIEYQELRYWRWRVAGIDATGHRVIPDGKTLCVIEFDMPAYWLPYVGVCALALRNIRRILG